MSGSPLSSDFAILKWTDTTSTVLPAITYIGFTNGARQQSIDYGASCVLLQTQYGAGLSPYAQGYPQQSYQSSYPYISKDAYSPNTQVKDWLLQMFFADIYRQKHTQTQPAVHDSFLVKALKGKYPAKNYLNSHFGETLADIGL